MEWLVTIKKVLYLENHRNDTDTRRLLTNDIFAMSCSSIAGERRAHWSWWDDDSNDENIFNYTGSIPFLHKFEKTKT